MSSRWPAGVIRKTPVTPAGPYQDGAAPGVWSLADAAYWVKQGLWPIAGNFLAVEDVFSTYLYTGNGSTQTITNGINLSGQGGMVWIKSRSAATDHALYDTVRGVTKDLASNLSGAQTTDATGLTAFNSNSFSIGSLAKLNTSAATYASWTFREAPKFFDVVTYTGDGANRAIAHNLGVAPGCIIVKRANANVDWQVYHRSNANTEYMVLNSTAAKATGTTRWNSTTPTATEFTIGTDATVNASGGSYIAYLFAHDATADGVIQCGGYTGNGSANGLNVTLGWEPQWVLIKGSDVIGSWWMFDNMRGVATGGNDNYLYANLTNSEAAADNIEFTATGFTVKTNNLNEVNKNFSYIAIRRGPMKTPTVGTTVFSPVIYSGNSGNNDLTTNFPVDSLWIKAREYNPYVSDPFDRLRGGTKALFFLNTDAEATDLNYIGAVAFDYNSKAQVFGGASGTSSINYSGKNFASWAFRRAPGFFDVVCYTGTGAAGRAVNHNLGVAPELMIVKVRNAVNGWPVYNKDVGVVNSLNLAGNFAAANIGPVWNSTAPTSSVFYVGDTDPVNLSGNTYVAYLFASCPGVSKVGSYTGNGSSQTINCGFSNGARFFLVKRTDSTGDWWVYDSARGIVAAADPALRLNSTAAEVTSADAVDTNSTGIIVNQETTCNINVNGATYIFLAIA